MPGIGTYSAEYRDYLAQFSSKILPSIRLTLREASTIFDEEITSYIEGCATDLVDAGVIIEYFYPVSDGWKCDGQILQAVRWYCLSNYGLYNPDMEKYAKAYASLKATICTQRKYTEKGG
jgi:hypothetical protein